MIAKPSNERSKESPQVILSRSQGFGHVNPLLYGSLTAPEDIAIFEEAMRKGKKFEGVLDIGMADYNVIIRSGKASRSIHLWINPKYKESMYTELSDTDTGHTIDSNYTKNCCYSFRRFHIALS